MNVGCVLMAAGNAERFGGNKLLAEYRGIPLIRRALDAIPKEALCGVAVVTQYGQIMELAREYGFRVIKNGRPELGVSLTVRLGTAALEKSCDGLIYQVADQPLLMRESVSAMLDIYQTMPDRIVAMAHGGVRGNPCVFPEDLFPELCALSGDTGGSAVIRRHPERLCLFEARERELADVDTPEALRIISEE